MTNRRRLILLNLAILGSAACTGLDTGNADLGKVELGLAVLDEDPVDQNLNVFTLTRVEARVRDIELILPDGVSCDGVAGCESNKIRVIGPWTIDLLTGVGTPPLPTLEVPATTYRRIDVRFEPDDADVTLSARGTVPFRGAATPFALDLKFDETARFESATGVVVAADALRSVVMRLDPRVWLSDLPLVACADDGDLPIVDGTIVLADGNGSCSDVENVIKDAIKESGRIDP